MTNETRNRIEAYKSMLPDMKERVMAAAFLMVMSIMMIASASFAWLTISRNPEVTGVNTSVTSNGNLEIALASGDKAPEESQVGDSSATKGQNIAASNITWGNLVNLSDPSYGLDNLTLRPAQLNQSALLTSPLYGAVYLGDGRVDKLDSSFAYSVWDADLQVFAVSNDVGVRAISSTKLGEVESGSTAVLVHNERNKAETANLSAGSAYIEITNNKKWMDSLAVVMGTFMTAKMNAGQGDESLTNPTIEKEDVKNLTELFGAFVEVYELQFEAMSELANYQLFLKNGAGDVNNSTSYTKKTAENIKESSEASLKNEGIQISGLDQAIKDYGKLVDGYEQLLEISAQGEVKWDDSNLNTIVNSLMDTGKCTLDGTPINNIGVSNATGYLDGKTHNATINNGVLYNLEKMNGARCDVRGLSVSAKVKRMGITIPASISANISTDAPVPSLFAKDLDNADKKYPTAKVAEVAQDTYGLAVDFWVRTNASGSYLTLEGNVLTKSEMVRAMGKDSEGGSVELYTLTRTSDEEGTDGTTESVTYTLDLYNVVTTNDKKEVTTWYDASSHDEVTLENGETPTAKMEELITVIGYEGENRVWEDANAWESNSQLSLDATTQGSGSCYVYYADSPEDQARSLKLLDSMNVAFVDDTGKLLATAIMDTEKFYAENGRVTVPLVLKTDSINVGNDTAGEKIYAITPLVKNEPMRITAIVYLDGTKLSNKDVLAASDIQGKLNIQFGSSITLSHVEDEALLNATRSVSATIDKSSFKYDESLVSGTPMTTNVTLTVDGDKPNVVKAFFIRAVSSTQGSREAEMNFTLQPDGSWKAAHTFTAPGNYILRSVELDGQTYDLETSPTVLIEGFTIESLNCAQATNRHVNIMTAANSSTVDLKLKFASDKVEAMPSTVQGRFLRDSDGTAVNINFTYNSGGPNNGYWTGSASFISSGEYTLEYLVLDGDYTQLEAGLVQTATVYLGMKTAVFTDSPTSFKYIPDELSDSQKNLYMKVKIMDNTGKMLEGLKDARLYYSMEGSSLLENGFSAQLTWDAEKEYYTGTFYDSKVGVFKFSHVTVGSNTITYAEDSPIFRIMSPEPPKYVGFNKNTYMYNANGGITMNARLSYSSTATVVGVIRDLNNPTKVYEVQGSDPISETVIVNEGTGETMTVEEWKFLIPTTSDGKQDGNWQLEEVRIWNYYDAAGNYIEAAVDKDGKLIPDGERDEPLVFAMGGNTTKAVTTLYITVSEIADADLGKDGSTVTGKFMDTYTISGLSVKIEDFERQEVQGLENVTLRYVYGNDSLKCGGYESADNTLNNAKADIDVPLTKNGSTYSQTNNIEVRYAGTYTPELKYKINNNVYNIDASKIAFAIYSVKPTLSINDISPKGSHTCITSSGSNKTVTSKIDGNVITIYPKSEASGSGCNKKTTLHEEPKVYLKLEEWGNADKAVLAFTSDQSTVRMYYGSSSKNGTQTDAYQWDSSTDKVVMRFIGYNDAGSCDDSEVAGTLTSSDKVVLTYGDETYNVTVPVITIKNNQP